MEFLSKEDLKKELAKLKESRKEDESYKSVKPVNAMCYSMSHNPTVIIKKTCACCQKECDIETRERDSKYEIYEKIALSYKEAGYNVLLKWNCPNCQANGKKEYEFILTIGNDSIVSYPSIKWRDDEENVTTALEYKIVLLFLKGNKTYKEILNDSNYSLHEKDQQVDMLQIDTAINKVLGIDITYNKQEALALFESFLDKFSSMFRVKKTTLKKGKDYLKNVLNKFSNDYVFTLNEYKTLLSDFVKSFEL